MNKARKTGDTAGLQQFLSETPEYYNFGYDVDEKKTFSIEIPEYYNFGYDVIDQWAKRDRNKLAMIWVNQHGAERRLTFHELSCLSTQAANLLLKHGIAKGDRVMLLLPRVPEWWIFSLAMIKLGVIQCPSPTLLTPEDLKYRIKFGRFKMVITDLENAPKFDEIFDECPGLNSRLVVDGERENWISYPSEIAGPAAVARYEVKTPIPVRTKASEPLLVVFTSGTSKYPKLVQHAHSYVLAHRITAELWHGVKFNDLHWTLSDTGWAKNLWGNYFGQWIAGACIFVYDIRGKFHADEVLPLLEKYEITSFCAPPTAYRMLVLNDLSKVDLRELRQSTAAGEPLHTETIRLWKEGTGLTIREGYGQTETVCMIACFVGNAVKPGSMGKPSPLWNIELHDDEGKPVAQGEDGRIAVKVVPTPPPGLFTAFVGAPEEMEKCFSGDFYYPGDKARCDADGYYWFVGRSDDIIKSSGYRISPMEVEEVMMQHRAVHEVAVIGTPDPIRGSKIKAYVVLQPGFEATESLVRELQSHVKRNTAPYKYPRDIEFMPSLPKTFSGKIKRDLLRRYAESGEMDWKD